MGNKTWVERELLLIQDPALSYDELIELTGRPKQQLVQQSFRMNMKRTCSCDVCGEQVVKSSGYQKYCVECAIIVYKFQKYVNGSSRRGYEFSLTLGEFTKIIKESCHYCGVSLETVGIDRVDNTRGYSLDNTVPCCSSCNMMKGSFSYDYFINHIKRMATHLNKYPTIQ